MHICSYVYVYAFTYIGFCLCRHMRMLAYAPLGLCRPSFVQLYANSLNNDNLCLSDLHFSSFIHLLSQCSRTYGGLQMPIIRSRSARGTVNRPIKRKPSARFAWGNINSTWWVTDDKKIHFQNFSNLKIQIIMSLTSFSSKSSDENLNACAPSNFL